MANERGRVHGGSVVFPVLLIGFGALMLVWKWVPDFHPWAVISKYWPLLFILVGAGMIWDRWKSQSDGESSFPIGSTLGVLAFVLVMAFLLSRHHTLYPHGMNRASGQTHESRTIELGGAKAVQMNVKLSTGELRIEGGAADLLHAEFFHGPTWPAPQVDYQVNDGTGEMTIQQTGGEQFMGKSDNTWDLRVSNAVPLELKVDMGAGRGDFRLANVDLTRMELNIGAGEVEVDLTGERAKDLQVEIHGGVGRATVKLPKNVGVVATAHGGLGSINVHGLKKEDGRYVNALYGKSPQTVQLTVEGGIGEIQLQEE